MIAGTCVGPTPTTGRTAQPFQFYSTRVITVAVSINAKYYYNNSKWLRQFNLAIQLSKLGAISISQITRYQSFQEVLYLQMSTHALSATRMSFSL